MSHLTIHDLSFAYGKTKVLHDLSLTVKAHEIYGFIGRNGAGKTTTLQCILGYLIPQSGTIEYQGKPVFEDLTAFKRVIGYVNDVPQFPEFLNAQEYLEMMAQLYGVTIDEHQRLELLGMLDLAHVHAKIGQYSRGMRQRLAIGAALLHQPTLLIMDEPTSALDPLGRDAVLNLMMRLKEKTTILYSTHILEDAQRVSDRIGIIEKGHMLVEGSMKALLQTDRPQFMVQTLEPIQGHALTGEWLEIKPQEYIVTPSNEQSANRIAYELNEHNIPFDTIKPYQKTLTSLYQERLHGRLDTV